jgi:hypothetical protein
VSPDAVTRAVQIHLEANPVLPQRAYANVPADFACPPWMSAYVLPGQATAQEIALNGAGVGKRVGVVKVRIVTGPGQGSQAGGAYAAQVEGLLRWVNLGVDPDEVFFEEPYTTENGPDNEGHYIHTVTAPWWCWTP